MTTQETKTITISTTVEATPSKVWEMWTEPKHIIQWNCPSPDWHTPKASHDLKEGGNFNFRMEARDGSLGFDFSGRYDVVKPAEYMAYTLDDNRKVKINFDFRNAQTIITQEFEAEAVNSVELQRAGWQSILDNFKKYVESRS